MRKIITQICFCALFIFTAPRFLFAQAFNVLDYFPMQRGIQWKYSNANGELLTTVTVMQNDTDPQGIPLAVFYSTDTSAGLTSKTVVGIAQNKIVRLAFQDPFGNTRPLNNETVLAAPGETWEYNGEVFTASNADITLDGNTLSDCICVEQTGRLQRDGKWVEHKTRTYYARGFGKVYVEVFQSAAGKWALFDKLIEFRE